MHEVDVVIIGAGAAGVAAVQMLLKMRSPAVTAPCITSGPTLLTGICFCAACGMAMTLRTGKGGRYRYRQGATGWKGRTVPTIWSPQGKVRPAFLEAINI